ncbi:MAG: VWA domain-containing protein [bacterium]
MDEVSIFTKWDGSQELDLDYQAMLDNFLEKYIEAGDVSFALQWMMHQGVHMHDQVDLAGIDRMIRQLWQKRSRMLREYNPAELLKQLRDRLEEEVIKPELGSIQSRESEILERTNFDADALRKDMSDLMSRQEELQHLPENLHAAVDQLKGYDFLNEEARQNFESFLSEMEQVLNFIRRNIFGGPKELSYERARSLIQELKELDRLIRALEQGRLGRVDFELLDKYLGEQAQRAIQRYMEFSEYLRESGYVTDEEGGAELSPFAVRKIGEKALQDIYALLGKAPFGSHPSSRRGRAEPLPDASRPWRFGDEFSVHLPRTVMNAVMRQCSEGGDLRLSPRDFEVTEAEHTASRATALLLDMSLSMFQGGRFSAAKKVALALDQLIRSKYPRDKFYLIGFSTTAGGLTSRELARAGGGIGEDIFTNIQDALELAVRMLAPHQDQSPQIILITDGQPTAYYDKKRRLHVEWPVYGMAPESSRHTLGAVRAATRKGVTINTFMLDRQDSLVRFVEEMTRINRGRAFFTEPDRLGKYILLDFIAKKRKLVQ